MKWTNDRSGNVDDRRGRGGGAVIGGGLGTLIIAAIVFFLGGDPSMVLNSNMNASSPITEQRELTQKEKHVYEFVNMLTGANEVTWNQLFKEEGIPFQTAKVVLFEQTTHSGCGTAQSAMGPFYCPADQTIYVDMSFFQELEKRFGAEVSDFTVAYVLGHEYGHHIQYLLGTLTKTHQMRQSGRYTEKQLNEISVATELQADFFAGLWANRTNQRQMIIEPGDISSGSSRR